LNLNHALIRADIPVHDFKQCGLASAVSTDKANPLTQLNLKRHIVEKLLAPKSYADIP